MRSTLPGAASEGTQPSWLEEPQCNGDTQPSEPRSREATGRGSPGVGPPEKLEGKETSAGHLLALPP